jgi:hypothetical protein
MGAGQRDGPARRGMGALLAGYAAFGAFWGTWVVVFAEFLHRDSLSAGQASLLFTAAAVVAVGVMTFAASFLDSLPRNVTVGTGLVAAAAGGAMVAVLPPAALLAGFAVLGAGTGLVDVFVNAAGQGIEQRSRVPVLQWVHAAYGFGGAVGAVGAGIAVTAGVSFRGVLAAGAAAQLAAGVGAWSSAGLRSAPIQQATGGGIVLRVFVRAPYLLIPASVVLFAFFVEGSMDVWSVIFLRKTLGASVMAGAGGFAAFGLAIALGRAFAAHVLFGLGNRLTILVSGAGSLSAGIVAVLTSSPVVASVAFLVLGFFLSAAAPAAFARAGDGGVPPGLAVAAITIIGYGGFVVGPPVMGWLADQVGLRATMVALVVATFGIAAAGVAGLRGTRVARSS